MCRIGIAVWVLLVIALAGLPAGVQAQSDDGLVAEWHFDEGAGNVVEDSSGNGNDGVIYGATWVEGKYGKALSFDGVDDYVEIPDKPSLDIMDEITIEAWIHCYDSYDNQELISKVTFGTNQRSYELALGPDNKVRVAFTTDGTADTWKKSTDNKISVSKNQWTHAVGIYDGQTFYVYINGISDGSTDIGEYTIFSSSSPLSIGRHGMDGRRFFNGIIDEIRIYNRALSPEEIKQHYESGPTSLYLTKTASHQSIKQGQTTTITLTLKNTGSTEIKDIEIADTIPQDLTFIDGQTSKSYAFLTPKDSRQFQYVIQINEAGTYNLGPATATYADEKGNYHTVKSKPAAIEVIPSLIETTDQIQSTTGSNAQTASVHLHGEKTDVVMGEDILLKLAAVNLITKPAMHVQVIITPPSGMSVTSSEFVQSGAGLFTASYEIEPGVGRDIEVKMRSNQVGDFVVNGRIVYYFGDDMDNAEDHTLTLSITVRAGAEAGAERTTDTSGSEGSSTPGFAAVAAVIGLLLAYVRKRT